MSKPSPTVAFPVRMPAELKAEIEKAAALAGLSEQDTIRLAIRVGLSNLAACGPLPDLVVQQAAEAGASFAAWVDSKKKPALRSTYSPQPPKSSLAAEGEGGEGGSSILRDTA